MAKQIHKLCVPCVYLSATLRLKKDQLKIVQQKDEGILYIF